MFAVRAFFDIVLHACSQLDEQLVWPPFPGNLEIDARSGNMEPRHLIFSTNLGRRFCKTFEVLLWTISSKLPLDYIFFLIIYIFFWWYRDLVTLVTCSCDILLLATLPKF